MLVGRYNTRETTRESSPVSIEIVKQILRDYVQFPCVEEVYTMDKEETPLLYAAKVNPSSSFKTLKIISNQKLDKGE